MVRVRESEGVRVRAVLGGMCGEEVRSVGVHRLVHLARVRGERVGVARGGVITRLDLRELVLLLRVERDLLVLLLLDKVAVRVRESERRMLELVSYRRPLAVEVGARRVEGVGRRVRGE